jgi:hypothetical protein
MDKNASQAASISSQRAALAADYLAATQRFAALLSFGKALEVLTAYREVCVALVALIDTDDDPDGPVLIDAMEHEIALLDQDIAERLRHAAG